MPAAAPDIPGISGWTPLARGGFATVWQARQESLDRLVAVKVDTRTLETEAERRRFLVEAKTAGRLSGHPGIVTVHDAGILADGRPYLVMKLCPGGSLTRWQSRENRQSEERVRTVGVRIADALAAAHAQGMLHRDVKPANILIDSYGNAGLADFGLAGPIEASSGEGITPAYAPPEVIRGDAASEAGDVYQLAATLYAVLGGEPPHGSVEPGTSLDDLLGRLDEPVGPLPWVNGDLMQVLLDALSRDPKARPTAAQLRDRLAEVDLDGTRSGRRRRPALLIGLVAVATVLVVLAASAGIYLYEIDRSVTANIARGVELPENSKRPVKDPQAVDALDYLLIGEDQGFTEDDDRSDAIMLVHLNTARDQAYVVSFPRDLLVPVGGGRTDTLNTTYKGGNETARLISTVEGLTDTRMDHVAKIDFRGFVGLTDELGGVTVNNPTEFTSHGHTYPVGRQTLRGQEALWYVQERKGVLNEQNRAEHQRLVLKAILSKGLSPEVIAQPQQFTKFVGGAAKRIQVDNELGDSELRSTAVSLRLRPANIQLLAVPTDDATKVDGKRGVPLDQAQFKALKNALRTDKMGDYVKEYPPR